MLRFNRPKTAIVCLLILILTSWDKAQAQVNWTAGGGANTSWATGANWSNGTGPTTTDIARFAAAGATSSPIVVTNTVNASRTIGGLIYETPSGFFQVTNLAGFTLEVDGDVASGFDSFNNTTTYLKGGGTLNVGSASVTGNLLVGRRDVGGSSYSSTLDLSGITNFNGQINNFWIGTSTNGQVTGQVVLPATNSISANSVRVGYSLGDNLPTSNILQFGTTNTLLSNEFTIGGNLANGAVTIPVGGTLNLGSSGQRTAVTIAQSFQSSAAGFNGSLNLTGATFNAYLSNLIVGDKALGGGGGESGLLVGGNSGSIDIGAPGKTANVLVGHVSGGNNVSGQVDFSGQSSLVASLNHLYLGTAEVGTANGTFKLAASNTIDANAIRVGYSTNDNNSTNSLLALGTTNTITTGEFTVGGSLSNGSVTIPSGGTLNLGTALNRTALTVGQSTTSTGAGLNGSVNLTGATVNAYLSNLIVGEKLLGGGGGETGLIFGGSSGAIDIGAPGKTANILIGHVSGGNGVTGIADFSGQTSLTASLNHLYVGTGEIGNASGSLKLANTNTIDANGIRVGYSTNDVSATTNLLQLGMNNTITTGEFIVGGKLTGGTVSIPVGGTLNLGTPVNRAALAVGQNDVATSSSFTSSFNLSGSTTNAYLSTVVIGERTGGGSGGVTSTFSTGNHGIIDAQTISLGLGTASGTLNFNGGTLIADAIAKGTGAAQFNWNDGILHVGAFGTAALPFNLSNTGTGILAPGESPGLTTVFGNYTQGTLASLQIELGGYDPGVTFDQLSIIGNASLAGKLSVSLFGGFQPVIGDSFKIVESNSITGVFNTLSFPSLPSNEMWQVQYKPTYVSVNVINAVPEPSTVCLGAIGLVGLALATRRGRRR